jgi:hypothetical protein
VELPPVALFGCAGLSFMIERSLGELPVPGGFVVEEPVVLDPPELNVLVLLLFNCPAEFWLPVVPGM